MSLLLTGKNIIIMGMRNKWSIAWGIAKSANTHGANLIVTYLGEREKHTVTELVSSLGNHHSTINCDVTSNEDIECLFTKLKEKYGVIHGLVHSIAYAKAEDIQSGLINTTKEGFALALDISAYSLVTVSNRVMNLMNKGGSIIALTFMGSDKVIPGYSVMGVAKASLEASVRYLASDLGHQGIRVNAISAGPIKTFSAKGVKNFNKVLDIATERAPFKRRTDHEDIGGAAVFFLSDLSKGVTGEILHVDCGLNIMGV